MSSDDWFVTKDSVIIQQGTAEYEFDVYYKKTVYRSPRYVIQLLRRTNL
jgi:hypothetical protein